MRFSQEYLIKNGFSFDFEGEGEFEHEGEFEKKSPDTITIRGELGVPGELTIVFPNPIVDVEVSIEGEWLDYEFCPD